MALLKDFDPSPACPSDKTSVKMKLSMEQWWNATGNGKSKKVKRNVDLVLLGPPKIPHECSKIEIGFP